MYRKCKNVYLCWFGNVDGMEGNRIVLVLTCTVSRKIENCVVLDMDSYWKETGLCFCLELYRVWKVIELCWFGVSQRMEGNNIVFFLVFTGK
jgi:hypothetical protein